MRRATTALLGAVLLPVAACSDSDGTADTATCKTALAKQYRKVMTDGANGPTPGAPASCEGLDGKTLKRLTGDVISEYLASEQAEEDLGGAVDEPSSAVPSESVSVSPECRTWIKAELLDESEEVDATPGYNACGALADDELQMAIDQVTEQLMAEQTPEP